MFSGAWSHVGAILLWCCCAVIAEQTGTHTPCTLACIDMTQYTVPRAPEEVDVEILDAQSILATFLPPVSDGGSQIHSYKVNESVSIAVAPITG